MGKLAHRIVEVGPRGRVLLRTLFTLARMVSLSTTAPSKGDAMPEPDTTEKVFADLRYCIQKRAKTGAYWNLIELQNRWEAMEAENAALKDRLNKPCPACGAQLSKSRRLEC